MTNGMKKRELKRGSLEKNKKKWKRDKERKKQKWRGKWNETCTQAKELPILYPLLSSAKIFYYDYLVLL